MTVNKSLFREIHDAITAAPDEFDMATWGVQRITQSGDVCGTSMCVAGWAVALTVPVERQIWNRDEFNNHRYLDFVRVEDTESPGHFYKENVENYAREVLGLDWEEATKLFHEINDDVATEMVAEYAELGDYTHASE